MAQFRYVDDNGQLQTIKLELATITLGRASSCDIVLVDDLISREHARLSRQSDGRWMAADLGSRNKTYVNGQAIKQKILVPGDVVRLGAKSLEYVDESAPGSLGQEIDFFLADREPPAGTAWAKINAPISIAPDLTERLVGAVEVDAFADSPEPIADRALAQLTERMQADRGFVALLGEDRRSLRLIAARSMGGAGSATFRAVSQSFVQAAHLQNVAGLYPSDRRSKPEASLPASALVAPLRSEGHSLGVIYLDRLSDKRRFEQEQLSVLMLAGVQLGAILGQLHRRVVAAQEAESAARIAVLRRLQASVNTIASGKTESLRFSARVLPGAERCGDLYTVVSIDDNRLLAAAVDAGGTGSAGIVQGASMLGVTATAVMMAGQRTELGRILNALSEHVAAGGVRQPLPMVVVWIDLVAGRVSYVNAGHAAPLLLTGPTRMVTLDQTSMLVGADQEAIYKPTGVDLPAKFRLILTSDGLVEAFNKAGQAFGDERMHEVLLDEQAFGEPEEVNERLATAKSQYLDQMPQLDDALILTIAKD